MKRLLSIVLMSSLLFISLMYATPTSAETNQVYPKGEILDDYVPKYPEQDGYIPYVTETRYDPRDNNATTRIKSQQPFPTCFIFAACAMMETTAYKQT